ncbi:MAG: DUF1015 domain-containing protein [Saprospiraceae bacterium]|nr:DUF1015 domain-containing protein [Saprospiraceae bacterium]
MKINTFKAVYPNPDYITSSDSFFKGMKEDFPEFRRSGLFSKCEEEALYIYRIRYADHAFVGLVALADIDDYLSGRIKRHEHTLADKEQIHLNLLLRNRAIVKPVLLTHTPVPSLTARLRDYISTREADLTIHFEADNIDHSWWAVADPSFIADMQRTFAEEIGESYIADGHHRSSAMALLHGRLAERSSERTYKGLLASFFAADQVEILDFNRIVDVFADLSPTVFMAKLSRIMDITISLEPVKPQQKHQLTMYLHREWYILSWKQEVLEKYNHQTVLLDVQLFNDEILTNLLDVHDIRTDSRIEYFPGVYGMDAFKQAVHQKEVRVGFSLFPVSLEEMMVLSDEEGVLPPKSTWFEPRMKNGILIYEF